MSLLTKLLVNTSAVYIVSYILSSGVHINSVMTALVVAVVLGVLNTLVKPLLVILTLPITIITLGLFTFVINAVLVLIVSALVPGFTVLNFWYALLFSLLLSLIGGFLNKLI